MFPTTISVLYICNSIYQFPYKTTDAFRGDEDVHLKFYVATKIFKLLGSMNYNDRCDPCQDGKMPP